MAKEIYKEDNFLRPIREYIVIRMAEKDKEGTILELTLKGKSKKNNILISLDDLEDIIIGINGLTKHIAKQLLAKDKKYSEKKYFSKELKEVYSMGLISIRSGSSVLDFTGFRQQNQDIIDTTMKSDYITDKVVNYMRNISINENELHLEEALHLSSILKPLNKNGESLEISAFKNNSRLFAPKILTFKSKQHLQYIIDKRKLIYGEEIYGTLKELNIKDYSLQLQLYDNSMQKIYFEQKHWEKIRDMLGSKVRIALADSKKTKNMISIEAIESFKDKKSFKASELLDNNIFGILKNENEMKDSVTFAKKLADEVF